MFELVMAIIMCSMIIGSVVVLVKLKKEES